MRPLLSEKKNWYNATEYFRVTPVALLFGWNQYPRPDTTKMGVLIYIRYFQQNKIFFATLRIILRKQEINTDRQPRSSILLKLWIDPKWKRENVSFRWRSFRKSRGKMKRHLRGIQGLVKNTGLFATACTNICCLGKLSRNPFIQVINTEYLIASWTRVFVQ